MRVRILLAAAVVAVSPGRVVAAPPLQPRPQPPSRRQQQQRRHAEQRRRSTPRGVRCRTRSGGGLNASLDGRASGPGLSKTARGTGAESALGRERAISRRATPRRTAASSTSRSPPRAGSSCSSMPWRRSFGQCRRAAHAGAFPQARRRFKRFRFFVAAMNVFGAPGRRLGLAGIALDAGSIPRASPAGTTWSGRSASPPTSSARTASSRWRTATSGGASAGA